MKCSKLYNMRVPTGCSTIPEHVRHEKIIRTEIVGKMDMGSDEVGDLDIVDSDELSRSKNNVAYRLVLGISVLLEVHNSVKLLLALSLIVLLVLDR